jgi:DUF4097 and DUF4098 domain-containing protein YvlB
MRRNETFAVTQRIDLDIHVTAGSVVVRSGELGTVEVSVDSPTAESFDISQLGDSVFVRQGRRGRSARVVVDVPTGTDVAVKGTSVDVSCRGALGSLQVRAVSGDVEADDVVRADVSVASGDARIGLIRDAATFNAASGDVAVQSVGGRLAVVLRSGDVRVDDLAGDAEIETVSGDVTLRRFGGSSLAVRTVSGNMRVALPSGIRVQPEISTMSGKVDLPQPAPKASAGERRSVRLRLRSVSGDIRIERAD